ncbi:MAG: dihydroorotase [Betaproteobacteria bacterium]|nr:dihydroorotase [Betaproteobacteria bacterium]
MSDFILRGGVVVFADRAPARHDILVQRGKIVAVLAPGAAAPTGTPEQSAAGLHVFPGLIDAHVHFGFGEKITEYTTETVYAAQGGIATILGYFLNNEAYADVFKREQDYARPRCHVDYGFHFSTANELHIKELGEYVNSYGVTSFKYFMNFKGEEGRYLGLDGTDDGFFWDLLVESARIGKPMIVCHTENIEIVNRARQKVQAAGGSTLKDWSACKPAVTESEPALRAMYFAERTGARVYFPHISSRLALDEVRRWRKRYEQVWIETCPHYLTHTEDSDLGGIGKANPPFRTKDDLDALWEAVADGTIDLIASDHCPRKRVTKDKPLWLASQGFPGIATILPVMLAEGYHKRKLPLQRICQLLASAPAKIFDLEPLKGRIAPGSDADFTIVDLERERKVIPSELGSYSDYSIYENQVFKGWPVRTIVRGVTVMDDGRIVGPGGHGQYLWRRIGQPPIPGKLS